MSDSCEVRTHAGYPTGLAGQRLNHSAKLSVSDFSSTHELLKQRSLVVRAIAPIIIVEYDPIVKSLWLDWCFYLVEKMSNWVYSRKQKNG